VIDLPSTLVALHGLAGASLLIAAWFLPRGLRVKALLATFAISSLLIALLVWP
jgi:hypothetical protein